ncbi:hypothetical protein ACSFXM_001204 [Vibrio cholerae]
MRIYTRIVIKLFFAFCFLFSASSFSAQWQHYSNHQLSDPYDSPSCLIAAKKQLQFWQNTYPHRHFSHGPVTPSQGSTCHAGFVSIYILSDLSCPSGSYPDYPSLDCKVTCNSDEVLNPETNTCDARCTAPDVWDPVTNQCITPKNRCDILSERQPVVELDWRQSTLGSTVVGKNACMPSGCVVSGTKDVGCLSDSDRCYGDAKYTGTECTYTEGVTSGWCSNETCSDQEPVEPVPDPENPNPEPPSPNPDPTPGDNLTPPNPDTSPDPNNPNLEEESNKGVVNELNTANKQLENIQKTLEVTLDEITTQNKDVDKANDKLILGIQNLTKAINDKPVGGGGGGSGGGTCPPGEDCSGAVASFDCEAETFQCKGDVIQCLSAEIQFKEHCLKTEFKQFETALKKITTVDNVKAIVQDEQIDLSKIDTKYLDGAGLKLTGRCPADYEIAVDIYVKTTVSVPLSDLCAAVERFAPLIILFGWISGIGLIGRQQGVF